MGDLNTTLSEGMTKISSSMGVQMEGLFSFVRETRLQAPSRIPTAVFPGQKELDGLLQLLEHVDSSNPRHAEAKAQSHVLLFERWDFDRAQSVLGEQGGTPPHPTPLTPHPQQHTSNLEL